MVGTSGVILKANEIRVIPKGLPRKGRRAPASPPRSSLKNFYNSIYFSLTLRMRIRSRDVILSSGTVPG